MFNQKSQTATEYLVILAVVIVIAVIVIGILGGIPSIGGGVSENQLRVSAKSLPLGINTMSVSCDFTKLEFQNNLPNRVTISEVKINNRTCTFQDSSLQFNLGERKSLTCFGVQDCLSDSFLYDFEVNYISNSANYTQTGEYAGDIVEFSGETRISFGTSENYYFLNTLENITFSEFGLENMDGFVAGTNFFNSVFIGAFNEALPVSFYNFYYFDSDLDACNPNWKDIGNVCSNTSLVPKFLSIDRQDLGNDSYWTLPEGFVFLGSGVAGGNAILNEIGFVISQ